MSGIDRLDVVATTISGSVRDWGKTDRLAPLFERHFPGRVRVHVVGSHEAAREAAARAVREGSRALISAGGAGTFNRVMQGILDAAPDPAEVRLGFLRKGSADLVGKALGISDVVEEAVEQIAEGLLGERSVPCDVIRVREEREGGEERNLVGFGGLGVLGEIPRFTEARWIKYYKGLLSGLLGDLGPFKVGTTLALLSWSLRRALGTAHRFRLVADGSGMPGDRLVNLLILNGDLGPDMPFCRGRPLGSGEFHAVVLRDLGIGKIPGQLRRSFSGRILEDPARWGLETRAVRSELRVLPLGDPPRRFPVNVDGLRWSSQSPLTFRIAARLHLVPGLAPAR